MPVQIRTMMVDDIPAAIALWSGTEGVELDKGDDPADIARFLQRNPGLSSVALDGNRLIGAVQCGHDGRRGWLYHLAVTPSHRGRGLARQMIQRCLKSLKNEGIHRALLFYTADNQRGHDFWLNQGWEDMPEAKPMLLDL